MDNQFLLSSDAIAGSVSEVMTQSRDLRWLPILCGVISD